MAGGVATTLTTTAQLAGGIRSLDWGGVEFIEASDHGRAWQSAFQANGHVDCYNPTEQGSHRDGLSIAPTTSRLEAFSVRADGGGAAIEALVRPAFWLSPGQRVSGCGFALNTSDISDFLFRRTTRLGVVTSDGLDWPLANVVQYKTVITIPTSLGMAPPRDAEPLSHFVVLNPASYLPTTFRRAFHFFPGVAPFTSSVPVPGPTVIENSDVAVNLGGRYGALPVAWTQGTGNDADAAVGVYSQDVPVCGFWDQPGPDKAGYAILNVASSGTMEMNVRISHAGGPSLNGRSYAFISYLAYGTFADVKAKLALLVSRLPPSSGNCPPIGSLTTPPSPWNGVLTGWTLDPNAGDQTVHVAVSVDGPDGAPDALVLPEVPAGLERRDVNTRLGYPGNHGFRIEVPPRLRDGRSHTYYVYARDAANGPATLLGRLALVFGG